MSAPYSDASALPGSASNSANYAGSRRLKTRYEFYPNSTSGFAELSPDYLMTGEQLYEALENVAGVLRVTWQTAATGPSNAIHYQEQAILVYTCDSSMNPYARPIEFTVTRNQHMLGSASNSVPYTVTVMFRNPPRVLIAEAWRILRAVVQGKELLPEVVHQYMKKSLERHMPEHVPRLASGAAGAPGSASASLSSPLGAVAPPQEFVDGLAGSDNLSSGFDSIE